MIAFTPILDTDVKISSAKIPNFPYAGMIEVFLYDKIGEKVASVMTLDGYIDRDLIIDSAIKEAISRGYIVDMNINL